MNYLQLKNIHQSYTNKPLLNGVEFVITKGQKVALISKNGGGKSTLLKIITGQVEPNEGEVIFHQNVRLGFLSQDFVVNPAMNVLDALFEVDSEIGQLIKKYEALTFQENPDVEQINIMLEKIDMLNAWDYEVRVKTVISKLQLAELLDQNMGSLSGGEAKRVALAKALIDEPDFLLLDEPTNHLDLDMIEWLENYLKKSHLTILMVTHDRYFLENVCDVIIELDQGKTYFYPGNYEYFLTKKAEREELQAATLHNLKQVYKHELEWVRRAPQARATKSYDRVKRFEDTKEAFQYTKENVRDKQQKLELAMIQRRLGDKVLKIHGLSKSFGDKKIVENFSHDFKSGERIGIVGRNGVGKSTFLDMLMGKLDPDHGSLVFGTTVTTGYYEQKHQIIDSDKRIIDVITEISNNIDLGSGLKVSATQLLERFLFTPTQQQARVFSLSGGERRRLYLLTVLLRNPNFLILDEPTNDLDIMTLAVLEEFLMNYQGCLIIISHDRLFLDKLTDHLFVFEGGGKITDFWGSYSDLKRSQSAKLLLDKAKNNEKKEQPIVHILAESDEPGLIKKKKLNFNERREFELLGEDIEKLERRKVEINGIFQTNRLKNEMIKELGQEMDLIIKQLEEKERKWLILGERD